jgi:hypothetical protein
MLKSYRMQVVPENFGKLARFPVIVITALDLTLADCKRINSVVERILPKNSFDPAHLVQIVPRVVASARGKNQVPEVAS